jgi:predicted nucleic-acid-binding protein
VIALDTNVLVRILLGDDPAQTAAAERVFLEHTAGAGVYVSLIVLAEIAWVLSAGYGLERRTIHERLESLVRTKGVFVEHVDVVLDALDRFAEGGADFADYLILLRADDDGASPLLTFDRRLGKEAGAEVIRY